MAIQWKERPSSRDVAGVAESLSRTDRFSLTGTVNESVAYVLASQFSAPFAMAAGQVVYRQEIRLSHQGHDVWYVEVPYGVKKQEEGSYTFEFSSIAGTVRVRTAKTETSFPAGGPDLKKQIDWNGTEARGVDLVIPATKFTYTFKHPLGVVNEAFAIAIGELAGRTNSQPWHGMPAGSALFLGHNGSGGSDQAASVRYEVAYSKNLTNETIAGITGVNKKGWEVAWQYTERKADGGNPAVDVKWIYVNRVYDEFDFYAGLGF